MRKRFNVAVVQLLFVLTGCAGGTGAVDRSIPAAAATQWHTHEWPAAYVASELPAGFVATATMRSGRITGALGSSAAFYYRGRIRTFGTFPGDGNAIATFATAYDEVVGYSIRKPVGFRALVFEAGTVKDLGGLADAPGTPVPEQHLFNVPRVIGNRGDIYGDSSYEAVLEGFQIVKFHHTRPPQMLVPDYLAHGFITDINGLSAFTGEWLTGNPSGPFATIGYGLNLHLMFGYRASAALALNDRGQVAGYIDPLIEDTNFSNTWRAFVWTSGSLQLLPVLAGAQQMAPAGINNAGHVSGSTCITYNANVLSQCRAFLYLEGSMHEVNALIPHEVSSAEPDIALPGMTDAGAFTIKTASGHYFLVRPVTDTVDY